MLDKSRETLWMSGRSGQIAARIDPAREQRIRYASQLENTSVSSFVVEAASEKAERVISEHHGTPVPPGYFDELLRALDAPPRVIPSLAAAAARVRESPAFEQR